MKDAKSRVVLIFGDPGSGKSHLARWLRDKHAYHLIELDDVYVNFVRDCYPDLYLRALNHVIAQHFETILARCDAGGITPGAVAAWREHVASLAEAACGQYQHVSVEGYLLLPALSAVQERLAGKAVVATVEARNRQYFIASSFEQIAGPNDDA
jgi:uridine kinase